MTNNEVFRAFANGLSAKGGSVRSEVTESGAAVLYSYATPIALKPGDGFPTYFDARKYSVTTSKQVNQAKREASYVRDMTHGEFRILCRQYGANLAGAR